MNEPRIYEEDTSDYRDLLDANSDRDPRDPAEDQAEVYLSTLRQIDHVNGLHKGERNKYCPMCGEVANEKNNQ